MKLAVKRIALCISCMILISSLAACGSAKKEENSAQKEETADSGAAQNDAKMELEASLPILAAEAEAVPLNEDEKEIIELVQEDIHQVTDETYAAEILQIMEKPGEFSGQLYQIEGVYAVKNHTPYVARLIIQDGKKIFGGLPLKYMEKNVPEGAWIRVTGVIQEDKADNVNINILELVAAEVLPKAGQSEIEWNGADQTK